MLSQDAVGDRCTLVDGSGLCVRVRLGWRPTRTCAQRVLGALKAMLPPADYVSLYSFLLQQPGTCRCPCTS